MSKRSFVLLAALAALPAYAQVSVAGAWARPAVPGQMGTGAFMTLSAKDGARVVGAASPVAGVVEIHEMKMEGNVMKMRAIQALDLPAGKTVELKPGGYHVMLLDLKQPLKVGEKFSLSLRIETHERKLITLPVEVEVAQRAPQAAGSRKH